MPSVAKVIAELRTLGFEPDDYSLVQTGGGDVMTLTLDGQEHRNITGFRVLCMCAEATHHTFEPATRRDGRGYRYQAPQALINAVEAEQDGAPAAAPAAGPSPPPPALAAAAAQAAQAFDGQFEAAGHLGDDDGFEDDLATDDSVDMQVFTRHLQSLYGQQLVQCFQEEMFAWEETAQLVQTSQDELQKRHDKGLSTMTGLIRPGPCLTRVQQALEQDMKQQVEALAAAERRAAERCRLVQRRMEHDPTAALLMYRGAATAPAQRAARGGPVWYLVAALLAVVAGLLVQATSPQAFQGLKSLMMNLGKQGPGNA